MTLAKDGLKAYQHQQSAEGYQFLKRRQSYRQTAKDPFVDEASVNR